MAFLIYALVRRTRNSAPLSALARALRADHREVRPVPDRHIDVPPAVGPRRDRWRPLSWLVERDLVMHGSRVSDLANQYF